MLRLKQTLSALVAALSVSALGQQPAPPPAIDETIAPYASIADSVTLPDGRQIHFVCMGEGAPTVILTAGLGGDATDWRKVQPALAKTTRTCAWDRPGFALSDGAAGEHDLSTSTAALEAALAQGTIAGPYVLVGHSFGGFESLLFADRHPDKVAGMVLVDPSFPDQHATLERISPEETATATARNQQSVDFVRSCAAALRNGEIRPGGTDPNGCFAYPRFYPQVFRTALDAKIANPVQYETLASFLANAPSGSTIVLNAARSYGAMPLVVLSATVRPRPPGLSDEQLPQFAALDEVGERGHEALAALSSRGINARVPGATHMIPQEKPQVVIDAVEAVVREVRSAEP